MAQEQFASVGPLAAASATAIRTATTVAAGAVVMNGATVVSGVAILDAPRSVLFTFAGAEPGLILTIVGTGAGLPPIGLTENIAGPAGAGTVSSYYKYKSITSITANQASGAAISIGTNAVNESGWIQFDGYAKGSGVAIQITASGTVNYTLQQTLDDPNSTVRPVAPAAVTWINSSDATAVGATASIQTNYQFAPRWAKIVLNSGTGSVVGSFIQGG